MLPAAWGEGVPLIWTGLSAATGGAGQPIPEFHVAHSNRFALSSLLIGSLGLSISIRRAMKPKNMRRPASKTSAAKKSPKAAAPRKPAAAGRSSSRKAAARPARKLPLTVPPLLLEGDQPAEPQRSGPGVRYALGPQPPTARFGQGGTEELPVAYGTKRLLLVARDPHWLYAHWDLTDSQLKEYNRLAADRHLVLRVFRDAVTDSPHAEVHVHPESRNWFVHVGVGGARYVAALGYYSDPDRRWIQVAASSPTFTPPDTISGDISVQFATIPAEISFEELISIVKSAVAEHIPLAEAVLQLKAAGFSDLPDPEDFATQAWTPRQEQAMAKILSMDSVRRIWLGSMEITELVRRQLGHEISSAAAAQFGVGQPAPGGLGSISSAYGGVKRQRGFWFNINAELIIYGATEPDAEVRIGERVIKLRRDGTFSYRFALPDGEYRLPAVALSAEGDDQRAAELRFARQTAYQGEVAAHPQDAKLKPPHPDHVE
jgi:hypothetical protein